MAAQRRTDKRKTQAKREAEIYENSRFKKSPDADEGSVQHGGEVGKIDAHSDVSPTFAETSKLNNKEFHKITKILSNKRMRFHLDNLIGQYDLNI